MAARKNEKQSFEKRLEAAEQIIARMESGEMTLEEMLKGYEEGTTILADLEKELNSAQQRLTVLRKQADGTMAEEPIGGES